MPSVMMLSRVVRRVPLDFDAPIGATWEELLLPEKYQFPECQECGGDGYTPEARQIDKTFYAFGAPDAYQWADKITQAEVDHLIEKGRLRTWVDGEWGSLPRMVAQVNSDNKRGGISLGGHDAINRNILIRFRCERLGIELNCTRCDGNGDDATDEQRTEANEWRPPEPPAGDGWQLWQTVSEGGPVSPVFETAELLAAWLEANETLVGSHRYTYAEWMQVIEGSVMGTEIGSGRLV